MAKDVYWPRVVLGMHFDGANGSTTMTDQTGKTITVNSNAQLSTAASKFGASSLLLDGSADYIRAAASDDFKFGLGKYTIDFWFNPSTTQPGSAFNQTRLVSIGDNVGGTLSLIYEGSAEPRRIMCYFNDTNVMNSSNSITGNAWYHVALVRDDSTTYLFINGVLAASTTNGYNIATGKPVTIGAYWDSSYSFKGNIDDLRITNGVARWTSEFTPPAAAFGDQAYTVSGTVLDSSGNGISRTVRAYRRDTGDLVGSATSNPATGAYSINVEHSGEVCVVMLDDAAGTLENDQILRTTPV